MNITLEELKTALTGTWTTVTAEVAERDLGQHIVVLDRGFVYVGNVEELPDRITITNAKCIRIWGSSQGLGELRNGPTASTKLDEAGTVVVYRNAVMHMIPCKGF